MLAFYDDQRRPSCAHCTGHEPVYACDDCGREDNPFGRRCGSCELHHRLSDLLADTTGDVHPRLRSVFDALMAAPRPQSVLYWLTRASSRPDLLRAMARGDMDITHGAFEQLRPDRAVIYVRDLLAAVDVLPPYEASVERITPWLRDLLTTLPKHHADLIGRFVRWQLLRRLRLLEDRGKVTRGSVQHARAAVLGAARFLQLARRPTHPAGHSQPTAAGPLPRPTPRPRRQPGRVPRLDQPHPAQRATRHSRPGQATAERHARRRATLATRRTAAARPRD